MYTNHKTLNYSHSFLFVEDEGSANSDIIPLLMKRKCLHATNSMKDVVMRGIIKRM